MGFLLLFLFLFFLINTKRYLKSQTCYGLICLSTTKLPMDFESKTRTQHTTPTPLSCSLGNTLQSFPYQSPSPQRGDSIPDPKHSRHIFLARLSALPTNDNLQSAWTTSCSQRSAKEPWGTRALSVPTSLGLFRFLLQLSNSKQLTRRQQSKVNMSNIKRFFKTAHN